MPALAALLLALGLPLASLNPLGADLPPLPIAAFPAHEPPILSARSWALYSVDEAALVWAADADEVRAPASVTKVMTALVVIEQGIEPDQEVTISARAASTPIGYTGQQKVYQGEVWTVEALMADMLVYSDNCAAAALAEHTAGSLESFVALMNQKAADLGMTNTHFENPHGLDASGHVSSARDLIRLATAAIQEPRLTRLTRLKFITFTPGGRVMEVRNTNRLLGTFPGVLGLKTGDTANAGEVLLSYAALAHDEFVGVVMGSPDHMAETADLMAYAGRILGPQDHFYAFGTHLDELAEWPAWRRARLQAAGPLDDGRRPDTTAPLSPAESALATALRDLLPALLGGER
ncbi:MAG: D-alanyl-D-alanine carboxypeptidase [Acidimicrobiia bacterium]|nr:D-alanyl-D-alanine carboxypeptidase [Acidimicrobiia bacterium]